MDDMTFARSSSYGSGVCLCFAFVFALFASVSPYWMWSSSWTYLGTTTSVSTGTYVVSSLTQSVPCGWWASCFISAQWNVISSFNNTLCTGEFYDLVGQYGFCLEEGNATDPTFLERSDVLRLPPDVVDIQALSISTTVLTFIAMFLACAAPAFQTTKAAAFTALLSLAATCTAIGAFAVAASYSYYQNFRTTGWFLPFTATEGGCDTDTCLVLSNRFTMWWGPAFGGMIAVFCFCFFATFSLFLVVADTVMEDRIKRRYAEENASFRAGADPEVPPAQGADEQNVMKG